MYVGGVHRRFLSPANFDDERLQDEPRERCAVAHSIALAEMGPDSSGGLGERIVAELQQRLLFYKEKNVDW
jgi:hypothetical protein